MDILQSDECFYNGTDAISFTFKSTLAVHSVFLVILLIWCIIWFFYCICNIEDYNHKSRGIYATIAKDAPENGINYKRWKDYLIMAWNFCQLFSFSFLDEFSIRSSEDSLFSISWIDSIVYFVKMILLQITGLGDLILFFLFLITIYVCVGVIIYCSYNNRDMKCCECQIEKDYNCKENCFSLKRDCFKGKKSFGRALLFYLSCGLLHPKKVLFDYYVWFLCGNIRFDCEIDKNRCDCCGCKFGFYFFEFIPFFLKTIIYDFLYIPILSSFIKVFVCTYTCDYDSSIMNKEDAYPPLDVYTSISCNSSYTIICFILSFFAIAFYHIRASYYICVELDLEYSGDVSTNQIFQYVQMIGKFILTVLSSMFYFQPFIPLLLNLLVFTILLIIVNIIPARTAFTMEHSRLYICLYTVQVLTALMALLSQIFSSFTSIFSLLTICCIPCGFVFGWLFCFAPSLNNSYPYKALSKLMLNKDPYIRTLASKTLLDEFEPLDIKGEKANVENYNMENGDFFSIVNKYLDEILNYIAFGSVYHRGLSLEDLVIRAGYVFMDSVRENKETFFFESYEINSDVNKEEGSIKESKNKDEEDYYTVIMATLQNFVHYKYQEFSNNGTKSYGNNLVSSKLLELFSLILIRDNYLRRISKNININNDFKIKNIPELLERSVITTTVYLLSYNHTFFEKVSDYFFKDYLFLYSYYTNSLIVTQNLDFFKNISFYYIFLYFGKDSFFTLISALFFNLSFLSRYNSASEFNYYSLLNYLIGISVSEYMKVFLPYLKMSYFSLLDYYYYNKMSSYNSEIKFFCDEKELLKNFIRNDDLFIDTNIKMLSSLSFLFNKDIKFCFFCANFVNGKVFVDSLNTLEKFKDVKSEIVIKKIPDKEKNDLYLLNVIRAYTTKCDFPNNYYDFKYDEDYNRSLLECLKEKERIFRKEINDNSRIKNDSSLLVEKKENKRSFREDGYSIISNSEKNLYTDSQEILQSNEKEEITDEQEDEGSDDDYTLEESDSEYSESVEEQDEEKMVELISLLLNNTEIPMFIKYLVLFLYSEINAVKEYALLALSSFLDIEKFNEEESKEIIPSFVHLVCQYLSKCSISFILYYEVKQILKYENSKNNEFKISSNHKRYLFIVIDEIVENAFNSSIVLSSDEINGIIHYLCNEDVIQWIGSFYYNKEDKEKVIRLLYILISCSKEDVLYSLFNFEESSVLLLLLENNGSYTSNKMSFLSLVQIMETFKNYRKSEAVEKTLLNLLLNIIFIFLCKSDEQYIYIIIKKMIEKYYLFDNDMSYERIKRLKEEFYEYIYVKYIKYLNNHVLSFISLSFSQYGKIRNVGNCIVKEKFDRLESCTFDREMKYGIYKMYIIFFIIIIFYSILLIFFRSFRINLYAKDISFGLIDSSLESLKSNENISSSNKVWNKNNYKVKKYTDKYNLKEGDIVQMEVDLRSEEKKDRCLYFFIKDRWDEVFFCGLPESVKFINLFKKDSSVTFISLEESFLPTEKKIEQKEKYWFSYEAKEDYKRKEREKKNIELYYTNSLSSLRLTSSNCYCIMVKRNKIVNKGESDWESCSFDEEMSEGVHRISFIVKGHYLIGLIDSSQSFSSYGETITESHIGVGIDDDGKIISVKNKIVGKINRIIDGTFITMEVNLKSKEEKQRTLKYFVNNKQIKLCFTNLPSKASLGLGDTLVEFVSYERVAVPTAKKLAMELKIEWERGKEGEIDGRNIDEEIELLSLTPYSSSDFSFSDDRYIKESDRTITHIGSNDFETCIINKEFSRVYICNQLIN